MSRAEREAGFYAAQTYYLRGDWTEAGRRLESVLCADPDDADARMLRVALERRRGNRQQARQELEQVAQGAGAAKWHCEITAERIRLNPIPPLAEARQADGQSPHTEEPPTILRSNSESNRTAEAA